MTLINREDALALIPIYVSPAMASDLANAIAALPAQAGEPLYFDAEGKASTQPAQVATPEQGDRVCEEADGCPTETAVLKRFWREHQNHPGEQQKHPVVEPTIPTSWLDDLHLHREDAERPGFHNLIRKGGAF